MTKEDVKIITSDICKTVEVIENRIKNIDEESGDFKYNSILIEQYNRVKKTFIVEGINRVCGIKTDFQEKIRDSFEDLIYLKRISSNEILSNEQKATICVYETVLTTYFSKDEYSKIEEFFIKL